MRLASCVLGLFGLLLLGVPHVTQGQSPQSLACPFGASLCRGRFGTGCYDPAYAACHNGLVCPTPLQPCIGPRGAQCYDPSRATCEPGRITPRPGR